MFVYFFECDPLLWRHPMDCGSFYFHYFRERKVLKWIQKYKFLLSSEIHIGLSVISYYLTTLSINNYNLLSINYIKTFDRKLKVMGSHLFYFYFTIREWSIIVIIHEKIVFYAAHKNSSNYFNKKIE